MQEATFTFLVPESGIVGSGAVTSGQARSVINGHIARVSHQKRQLRQQQQQESRDLIRSGSRRVSDRPQCRLHRFKHVQGCSWCQQAAINSANVSVSLHYGNSDPFDSLPIPMDAKACSYLSFGRDFIGPLVRGIGPPDLVMSPGQPQLKVVAKAADEMIRDLPLYSPDEKKKTVGNIASRDLFGGQLALHNFESTPPHWIAAHANSVLAYCASTLWSVSGDRKHLTESLKYTAFCMTAMQKCLPLASTHPEYKVEELVYRLLRAEMVSKNYSGATIHTKYLQQILEKKAEVETLDHDSLIMVMHSDNNLALSKTSQPLFVSTWLRGIFSQSWDQADILFPHDIPCDIDYRAPNIELQEILGDSNKFFWQCSISRARGSLTDETSWRAVVSRREWLLNRVLHHYMGMIEENECATVTGPPASSVDALFEQCLVLAVFNALRFQKEVTVVSGSVLYSTSAALLYRTLSTFTALEQAASEDWFRVHAQPVIWIVFVAALIEAKLQTFSPGLRHERPWFERLRHCIKQARLGSWPRLSAVLGRFPYTARELPLPYDGWLDEVFELVGAWYTHTPESVGIAEDII